MSLHLTPAILIGAYEYLRATPPFRGWRLPGPDDIIFKVTRTPNEHGSCHLDGADPVITISTACNSHTTTLLTTMAHEMVHLHHFLTTGSATHGVAFRRAAKLVCRAHGFDPGSF